MNGWMNRTLLLLLLVCVSSLLVVFVWLVWPYDVVRFEQEPMPVERGVVHPGEVIAYHAVFTKFMNVSGWANVRLMDHTITFYPPQLYGGTPGDYNIWSRTFAVPLNQPPGTGYYLDFNVEYRVNPVRTIIERYRTEAFEVVK
jgi:hypothetical protein